mmetsp:Transcript_39237/g.94866  ORF Transcript_39237/g.94866 Transcript_39237/m.94866 type:complete len:276 (+) Transcript_39237:1668-2495(+)
MRFRSMQPTRNGGRHHHQHLLPPPRQGLLLDPSRRLTTATKQRHRLRDMTSSIYWTTKTAILRLLAVRLLLLHLLMLHASNHIAKVRQVVIAVATFQASTMMPTMKKKTNGLMMTILDREFVTAIVQMTQVVDLLPFRQEKILVKTQLLLAADRPLLLLLLLLDSAFVDRLRSQHVQQIVASTMKTAMRHLWSLMMMTMVVKMTIMSVKMIATAKKTILKKTRKMIAMMILNLSSSNEEGSVNLFNIWIPLPFVCPWILSLTIDIVGTHFLFIDI